MKRIAISILGLVMFGAQAAAPAAPATSSSPPATSAAAATGAANGQSETIERPVLIPSPSAAATGAANGQSETPSKEALQQAFDGAMTCSALSALIAQTATADEVWRWKNRSFAFGMLAANFYVNATQDKLSNEDMDNMLTQYANSLQGMNPRDREPFDTGCARKYAQIDQLCEVNDCPNSAPGTPAYEAPAGAPLAKPAK